MTLKPLADRVVIKQVKAEEKTKSGIREVVGAVYWCVLTAIYLTWSFLTNHWHISWIVFAVGGVLFQAVMSLCDYFSDRKGKDHDETTIS